MTQHFGFALGSLPERAVRSSVPSARALWQLLSESSALPKALGACCVVFPAGYVVFLVKDI